mmetsp:Transcript_17615/g.54872  ORF Transcript_17615/g.54872 Transcript_17615/m.54872 type:complete len:254 (-) Transcript_17615:565-1326(-)
MSPERFPTPGSSSTRTRPLRRTRQTPSTTAGCTSSSRISSRVSGSASPRARAASAGSRRARVLVSITRLSLRRRDARRGSMKRCSSSRVPVRMSSAKREDEKVAASVASSTRSWASPMYATMASLSFFFEACALADLTPRAASSSAPGNSASRLALREARVPAPVVISMCTTPSHRPTALPLGSRAYASKSLARPLATAMYISRMHHMRENAPPSLPSTATMPSIPSSSMVLWKDESSIFSPISASRSCWLLA